jgi:hypothetical protein
MLPPNCETHGKWCSTEKPQSHKNALPGSAVFNTETQTRIPFIEAVAPQEHLYTTVLHSSARRKQQVQIPLFTVLNNRGFPNSV